MKLPELTLGVSFAPKSPFRLIFPDTNLELTPENFYEQQSLSYQFLYFGAAPKVIIYK